jgi:hypothetical protein
LTYAEGIAEAINKRFPNVEETIEGRFKKIAGNVTSTLAPLGESFLQVVLERVGELDKKLGDLGKRETEVRTLGEQFANASISVGDLFLQLTGIPSIIESISGTTVSGINGILRTIDIVSSAIKDVFQTLVNSVAFVVNRGIANLLGSIQSTLRIIGVGDIGALTRYINDLNSNVPNITSRIGFDDTRASLNRKSFIQPQKTSAVASSIVPPGNTSTSSASDSKRSKLPSRLPTAKNLDLSTAFFPELPTGNLTVNDLYQAGVFNEQGLPSQGDLQRTQESLVNVSTTLDRIEKFNGSNVGSFFNGLGVELREIEPGMLRLVASTNQTAEAFFRLGQNISESFSDVRSLLSELGNSFKQFINDLIGGSLRAATQSAFGALSKQLGGLFNPAAAGGSIFTGGFAGGNPAAAILGGNGTFTQQAQFMQSLSSVINQPTSGGGASNLPFIDMRNLITSPARSAFSFSNLAKSAAPGIGGALGGLLGGSSQFGQITGSVGGLIAGTALTGGKLLGISALGGPVGIAVGGALLGVSLLTGLFGKAKQRRADEQQADEYVQAYRNRIVELISAVDSDQLRGSDALNEQKRARDEVINLLNSIKTKSVRDSRINNSINTGETLAKENLLREAVARQSQREADIASKTQSRRDLDSRLVPEFATGGVVPYTGMIFAHQGEVILNQQQQSRIGLGNIADAGVPGIAGSSGSSNQPIVNVDISIGTQDQTRIFLNGANSPHGKEALRYAVKSTIYNGSVGVGMPKAKHLKYPDGSS